MMDIWITIFAWWLMALEYNCRNGPWQPSQQQHFYSVMEGIKNNIIYIIVTRTCSISTPTHFKSNWPPPKKENKIELLGVFLNLFNQFPFRYHLSVTPKCHIRTFKYTCLFEFYECWFVIGRCHFLPPLPISHPLRTTFSMPTMH